MNGKCRNYKIMFQKGCKSGSYNNFYRKFQAIFASDQEYKHFVICIRVSIGLHRLLQLFFVILNEKKKKTKMGGGCRKRKRRKKKKEKQKQKKKKRIY